MREIEYKNKYCERLAVFFVTMRRELNISKKELSGRFNAFRNDGLTTTIQALSQYEKGDAVCPGDKFLKFQKLRELWLKEKQKEKARRIKSESGKCNDLF